MTLVAYALAAGDCIDDADALRAGGTGRVLGCTVEAPSTLGSSLWGNVRQLDRVSRELLARAWAPDGRPGDGPLSIDLDSNVCENFGLSTVRRQWRRSEPRIKYPACISRPQQCRARCPALSVVVCVKVVDVSSETVAAVTLEPLMAVARSWESRGSRISEQDRSFPLISHLDG